MNWIPDFNMADSACQRWT